MAIIYDKSVILQTLVTWINDISLGIMGKKFRYAGNDINSNLGEPSKSYIQGQFYYNTDLNVVYISLILDPNTTWGYRYDDLMIYNEIINHVQSAHKRSLLEDLRIEFLFPENSLLEQHEINSKCRTQEINSYIYPDIMYLWKDVHGNYMFIRDSTIHIDNKYKMIANLGIHNALQYFKEYTNHIVNLNNGYDISQIQTIFNTYIGIYNNDLYTHDNTLYIPRIIADNDITKFYLLNFTDYSIKKTEF